MVIGSGHPDFNALGVTGCRKLKAAASWTPDKFSLMGTPITT